MRYSVAWGPVKSLISSRSVNAGRLCYNQKLKSASNWKGKSSRCTGGAVGRVPSVKGTSWNFRVRPSPHTRLYVFYKEIENGQICWGASYSPCWQYGPMVPNQRPNQRLRQVQTRQERRLWTIVTHVNINSYWKFAHLGQPVPGQVGPGIPYPSRCHRSMQSSECQLLNGKYRSKRS